MFDTTRDFSVFTNHSNASKHLKLKQKLPDF